jgi:hypothetical protein
VIVILFNGPLELVHLIPKVAMKVEQGPGSQLRILLKRVAIQTNSLVGHFLASLVVPKEKMVVMREHRLVKI